MTEGEQRAKTTVCAVNKCVGWYQTSDCRYKSNENGNGKFISIGCMPSKLKSEKCAITSLSQIAWLFCIPVINVPSTKGFVIDAFPAKS